MALRNWGGENVKDIFKQLYFKPNICTFTVSATNGGPAAPPPPPPPPPPEISDDVSAGSSDQRSGLLAELNKGEDVTRGNILGRTIT